MPNLRLFHAISSPFLNTNLNLRGTSVTPLDARPTGGEEVAGSTPAKVGNILFVDIDHEIFSMVILSLLLIKKGSC